MQSQMATPPPHKAIEDGQCPADKGKEEGLTEQEANEKQQQMVEEWTGLKVKLQKATKKIGELSNDATTVQGALQGKAHLIGPISGDDEAAQRA